MGNINSSYTSFYKSRQHFHVYPTEFVVRTFLADYPNLNMPKPKSGAKVLDVGMGDGRNTLFLCDQGYNVFGTEITEAIVNQTADRMKDSGYSVELKVGRNSSLPYERNFFDILLGCHVCYYCDENETIEDNLSEYSRVLKKGGFLITSVANSASYVFDGAELLEDGSMLIKNDPYNNRNGYKLRAFENYDEIKNMFSKWFNNFSFGQAHNNYYGIDENVFWVVCQKK